MNISHTKSRRQNKYHAEMLRTINEAQGGKAGGEGRTNESSQGPELILEVAGMEGLSMGVP